MGSSLLSTLENSINNSYVLLFLEKKFPNFLPENITKIIERKNPDCSVS